MQDYIHIGSTPADEPCAQVGSTNYAKRGNAECRRFATLLQQCYPHATFRIKAQSHDFGVYYEVVAYYDTTDEASMADAYDAESCPTTWAELEEMARNMELVK